MDSPWTHNRTNCTSSRFRIFLASCYKKRTPHKLLGWGAISAFTLLGILGGAPLLLTGIAGLTILSSLATGQQTEQLLNRWAIALGGWRLIFSAFAVVLGVSLLTHGQPAHAIFDGARKAAEGGIGKYIGKEESVSLIDTLLFAFWALAAVGGLAAVAGGVIQQIQVLVGGLVLFFGMAVLIGILEFTDSILFTTS